MPESCLRALCECLTTSVALLMAVGLSLEARMMGLEAGAMQRGATWAPLGPVQAMQTSPRTGIQASLLHQHLTQLLSVSTELCNLIRFEVNDVNVVPLFSPAGTLETHFVGANSHLSQAEVYLWSLAFYWFHSVSTAKQMWLGKRHVLVLM